MDMPGLLSIIANVIATLHINITHAKISTLGEMIDDIFEPQIRTRIRWKYYSRWKDYKKSYYGLGWRIVENNESTIAYHGGYVNGYRSQLAINTDEDIGICILTNSPTSFSSKLVPVFLKKVDEIKELLKAEEANQFSVRLEQ